MVPSPSLAPQPVRSPGSTQIQTRTLYIVCIALYILSVLALFIVTTAADARDTRDRILDATIRLLRRQGYTATGIKQIVAEGDAPLGSVYHYFPGGKEQIGVEALLRSGERMRRDPRAGRRRARPPGGDQPLLRAPRRAPARLRLLARLSDRHRRARDRPATSNPSARCAPTCSRAGAPRSPGCCAMPASPTPTPNRSPPSCCRATKARSP